jgi:predicted O-linked N-acetylglucosamine transferase (SPINDLY family)
LLRFGYVPDALYRGAFIRQYLCDFPHRARTVKTLWRWVLNDLRATNFSDVTPLQTLMFADSKVAKAVGSFYARNALASARDALCSKPLTDEPCLAFAHAPAPAPAGTPPPLRVGFLSRELGHSSVGQLLPGLFASLRRGGRVETFAYALNSDDGTQLRQRLKTSIQNWRDLAGAPLPHAAAAVNGDGLSLIFDLSGHLCVTCMHILATHPARAALSMLGWLSASGSRDEGGGVSAAVSDRLLTPPEFSPDRTERLALLPLSYQVRGGG